MSMTDASIMISDTSTERRTSGTAGITMVLSGDVGITCHLSSDECHRLSILRNPLNVPYPFELLFPGNQRLGLISGQRNNNGAVLGRSIELSRSLRSRMSRTNLRLHRTGNRNRFFSTIG